MRDEVRLILVDAEMPEMDGYVLTKNIKQRSAFRGGAHRHAFCRSSVRGQPAMGKVVGGTPTLPNSTLRPGRYLRPLIER